MKIVSLFLLFFFTILFVRAQNNNSEKETNSLAFAILTLQKASQYDAEKIVDINNLKSSLSELEAMQLIARFKLNSALFQEYKVFKQDSAFFYGLKMRDLAFQLDSIPLKIRAVLNLAEINISAGMYKEGLEFLESIDTTQISKSNNVDYYRLIGRGYNELAKYSNLSYYTDKYLHVAIDFRKKALKLVQDHTFEKVFLGGIIALDQGNFIEARQILSKISENQLTLRQSALLNSVLGYIYEQLEDTNLAIHHFSLACIADIQSSTKETSAATSLATLLYKVGETEKASIFIQKANEDAEFFGAQQRKIQVGSVLPIIEEQMVQQIEKQKEILHKRNLVMMMLIIFLVGLAVIIWSQVHRIQKAKKLISETNQNLQTINDKILSANNQIEQKNHQLKKLNHNLIEANKIKEEYLGLFFMHDAQIFEKFKEFKAKIDGDIEQDNFEKLKYTVKGLNLKREKERLLTNFDEAFIHLFPNFVKEFNSLLKKEEQITVKKNNFLNKELRIFALMRLGIKRHDIIAQILDFNINSVYTYKTRIRKKSKFSSKEFDEKLFENTTLKL